jgi:thiol-disulfide isomerase/thioredoxin
MKRIAFILLSSGISLLSLAQDFTIKGKLKGQGNEKITLRGIDGEIKTDAANDVFELTGTAGDEPFVTTMSTSVDRNMYLGGGKTGMFMPAQPLMVVLSKGARLTITGTAKDLHQAMVTGDELNEGFNEVRRLEKKPQDEMAALQTQLTESRIMGVTDAVKEIGPKMLAVRKSMSATRKKYIKEHPDAFASLFFLSMDAKEYSLPELETAYNGLSSKYKNTRSAKGLESKIASLKVIRDGGPAPDFTKMDINGKRVSLSEFRGKYVLLDFWGSWCAPCRAANPHLRELYAKYASKGFEIVGVASEKVSGQAQAEKLWKEAVEKDGLTWTNLLNNELAMEQDATAMYSIEGYPTQILLDQQGKIIARWLGAAGAQLDEKLNAIFKN